MKYKQTTPTGGDETAAYDVTEYKAETVGQFIEEATRGTLDWGYFKICKGGHTFAYVEYKREELLGSLSADVLAMGIEKVQAAGGWYRMDYYITPICG